MLTTKSHYEFIISALLIILLLRVDQAIAEEESEAECWCDGYCRDRAGNVYHRVSSLYPDIDECTDDTISTCEETETLDQAYCPPQKHSEEYCWCEGYCRNEETNTVTRRVGGSSLYSSLCRRNTMDACDAANEIVEEVRCPFY
jgi:hypothetical protein